MIQLYTHIYEWKQTYHTHAWNTPYDAICKMIYIYISHISHDLWYINNNIINI